MEPNEKEPHIKEKLTDSENAFFQDSGGNEHIYKPYETTVKKELPEISEDYHYESYDFFQNSGDTCEPKSETLYEPIEEPSEISHDDIEGRKISETILTLALFCHLLIHKSVTTLVEYSFAQPT